MQEPRPDDVTMPTWASVIPDDWATKRVKHVARFTTGWTPPSGDVASYTGENPWATIGDLGSKVLYETANHISDEAAAKSGIPLSPAGSLLFSFKLSVGQVSIAGRPMFTNEAIATFAPEDGYDTRWAFYAFPEFITQNSAINIYGARLLNQQRINDAALPLPPLERQRAIAAYLDAETTRIDRLIDEKKKLKRLLVEFRNSTITDAVLGRTKDAYEAAATGGTWKTVRLRFKARINPKATVELNPKDEVSFVPMESIGDDGALTLDRTRLIEEVSQGYTYFEEGDVSIAKITPCFENGKGAVMRGLVGGVGFGTTELIVMRPEDDLSPRFLYYVMQSEHFRKPGEAAMLGAGGQRRVPDLFVKDFANPWPAIDVQESISLFLDEQTSRIDKLFAHVDEEITLLRQLRSATITDAVLGRIDVCSHMKS